MRYDRGAGPVSMPADDLEAFFGEKPTGAVCVTDAAGRLLALPARVLGQLENRLSVEIEGLNAGPELRTDICVVADSFPTYEAIRGIIAHGSILADRLDVAPTATVVVAVARTITFSFANVAR